MKEASTKVNHKEWIGKCMVVLPLPLARIHLGEIPADPDGASVVHHELIDISYHDCHKGSVQES